MQARHGGEEEQHQQHGGFLDSMRDAVLGQRASRGSVPTVRWQATQSSFAGASDEFGRQDILRLALPSAGRPDYSAT